MLAAVFSVFFAVAEEFSLLRAETPSNSTEIIEEKIWLPIPEPERASPIPLTSVEVSVSIYHPEPGQTDSSPFITADGSRINPKDPGKHRWVAVSRNLHKRWGGDIAFGDSIWVSGISEEMDGLYYVHDVMNSRFQNKIDILVGRKDNVMGLWHDVKLAKFE